jgi:hypothetical protein
MELLIEGKVSKRIKKYVEAKVIIEPHTSFYRSWEYNRDDPPEEQARKEVRYYRRWADELKDFFRDHRSQDVNDVYVDVTEIDACNQCGEAWEEAYDEDKKEYFCAYCGAHIRDAK